jgi:hypothetical protein
MEVSYAVTTLLSEVDERTVAVELARLALEKARAALDDTLNKGDALGIARGKLKKLGEDRLLALIDLGALPASRGGVLARTKPAEAQVIRRPRRRAAAAAESYMLTEADLIVRGEDETVPEKEPVDAITQVVAEVAVIDAGVPALAATVMTENVMNVTEMVDASAIFDAVLDADAKLPAEAEAGGPVVDIGSIDFDALDAVDDMDAAAAAAVLDLSAEEVNPLALIEAELERAEAALKAA